jgi:Calx-beta domain-containing protein/VCBS repeat protein
MKSGRQLGKLRSRIIVAAVAALTFAGIAIVPRIAQAAGPTVDAHNATSNSEGAAGTSDVTVNFTLSAPSNSATSATYSTHPGTATADVDYVSQTGTVDFAANQTSANVVFHVKGDTIDEDNETFTVTVDSATNGYSPGTTATVTINDDDGGPSVSMPNPQPTDEGSGGGFTTNMDFTVRLSSVAGRDTTFYAFTADPRAVDADNNPVTPDVAPLAATEGTDYTSLDNAGQGTAVTVTKGQQTATVHVPIKADAIDEYEEFIEVQLKATRDANAPDVLHATGEIKDDDAAARLDVSDPSPVLEDDTPCDDPGNNTPTIPDCTTTDPHIDFTVTLTGATEKRIVVDADTADRSATAGTNSAPGDYEAVNMDGDPNDSPIPGNGLVLGKDGTAPFVSSVPVRVYISGDNAAEPDERFALDLSNPVDATIGDGEAFGLIQNDDGGSFGTVSVSDATPSNEGSTSAAGSATFTVTANRPNAISCGNCPAATADITFFYTTADGPESGTGAKATAPSDYGATSGSMTIQFPQTTKTVTVNYVGDAINEPDEFFQLQVTDASNAAVVDPIGVAKIVNDDPAPTLSIADKTVTEGTGNTPTTASMTVTLSPASGSPVTVDCSTPQPNSGTATAADNADYTSTTHTLTFDPGQTSKTCDIPVTADSMDEDNETVAVSLSNPTGATINDGAGVLTITDDDNPPTISIGNTSDTEGSSTNTTATFAVSLSAASAKPITVNVATADGTAHQPGDYTSKTQTLTFNPGDTEKDFDVTVIADTVDEPNETFTATLSSPNANATLGSPTTGTATIVDDDDASGLSINNATVTEGNTGTTNATFTVTLAPASAQTVTVHYATADGTATQPADYTATSGDLSFAPNETTKTINVPVKGDTTDEPDEGFTVNLSSPVNATIADGSGNGTITDDDVAAGAPAVSVGNATANEGDNATFTFTLSAVVNADVTVNYSTADGTATAPGDYTAVPAGVATIPAGQNSVTADVPTTEDTTHESAETFTVTINNATNANVDQAHKTGTGTINDDDAAPTNAQITTGAGPGGGPHIQSFRTNSATPVASFMDGDTNNTSGKRVARGDLDGDGVDEIITGSGPNSAAVVSVYSSTGHLIASSFAYLGGRFYGGVFVAAGDIDGDGKAEVITGAGPGGGPHVIVWKLVGNQLNQVDGGFFAYGSNFAGGVTVAAGDVNGDGKDEIIAGPGAGGGPDVEVTTGTTGATRTRLFGFMAYTDPNAQPNWTGGINVAAGDVDGDGKAEIVVVPWSGGGPHLRLFNHDGSLRNGGIMVGSPTFPGGLTVAMGDLSGDGKAEIVVGVWSGTNRIKAYTGDLQPIPSLDFQPYGSSFTGGNFVAVGKA